jgi:hypothetical protein
MPVENDKRTIVSMAVIASLTATQLHEGVGHALVAWMRGDIPTELTTNHVESTRPDAWVSAGGTLVNLLVGAICLIASRRAGDRPNTRYFLWLLGSLNLLPGAGYFLFSGIGGLGDWNAVIEGSPHYVAWRIAMTLFGLVLYFACVLWLGRVLRPFSPDGKTYNTVARLPYYAACLFSVIAGLLDPMGIPLLLASTIPAAFGGSSGLMWADSLMRKLPVEPLLTVHRHPAWWIAAIVLGSAYILIVGPGIRFTH